MTDATADPLALRPGARALPLAMLLAAAGAIAWASVAELDSVTRAEGRVVPSLHVQRVAHAEGGTLRAVHVRAGARVARGAPLLTLDPVLADAGLERARAETAAARARVVRLEAEVAGRAPVFPPSLAEAAPAAVAAERALHAAATAERAGEETAAAARLEQARRALSAARAEAAAARDAASYAAEDAAMLGALADKGIEPRASAARAEAALKRTRSAAQAADAAVAQAEAGVREAEAMLGAVRTRHRRAAADALVAAEAALAAAAAPLAPLSQRAAETIVRAPVAGTVQRVLAYTPGSAVRAGEPLIEIVPLGDGLVIEARVAPRDISAVTPGQPARIRLSAYPSARYGALDGVVEVVSPDIVADERGGEPHYLARIGTRGSLRGPDGRTLAIIAGMGAEVDMLGERRTVLSYLAQPFMDARERALTER